MEVGSAGPGNGGFSLSRSLLHHMRYVPPQPGQQPLFLLGSGKWALILHFEVQTDTTELFQLDSHERLQKSSQMMMKV
jgi:hypothetical protein